MTAVVIAVSVVVAYLLGSIPFGLLVGRARGIDIREHGSKNIGATNVWRVLGKKWGLITFACDLGKGLVAVLFAKWIAARLLHGGHTAHDSWTAYAGVAAALGCILGHSFPVWLQFKGGKGVATSLGVIFGMMPWAALATFALWAIVFKVSRYVSLASIIASAALPVIVVAMLFLNWIEGWANFYFAVAAALLVIRRHRENIKRLIAGTENRFGKPTGDATNEAPPQ